MLGTRQHPHPSLAFSGVATVASSISCRDQETPAPGVSRPSPRALQCPRTRSVGNQDSLCLHLQLPRSPRSPRHPAAGVERDSRRTRCLQDDPGRKGLPCVGTCSLRGPPCSVIGHLALHEVNALVPPFYRWRNQKVPEQPLHPRACG